MLDPGTGGSVRAFRNVFVRVCLIASLGLAGPAVSLETIVLVPDDRASWRPKNLFGFLRPGHNYGERSIRIETTPAGATVDLFYIRANFQKRYEQAEAPVKVVLPPRSQAGPRDAVMIRAFLEGYKQKEVSIRVASKQDKVLLELLPLPNSLVAASHVYLAGRASLTFLTKESLEVRVQKREQGFGVILAETAQSPGVAEGAQVFRWVKTVDASNTKRAGTALLEFSPQPLGRIFKEEEPILCGKVPEGVHIRRAAVELSRHDRPRSGSDGFFP